MLCGMIRIDLDWSQEGILTSHKCTVAHKDTGGKNIQASWASAHGWSCVARLCCPRVLQSDYTLGWLQSPMASANESGRATQRQKLCFLGTSVFVFWLTFFHFYYKLVTFWPVLLCVWPRVARLPASGDRKGQERFHRKTFSDSGKITMYCWR